MNSHLNISEATLIDFDYTNQPLIACYIVRGSGDLKYNYKEEESGTLFAFTQPHRGIALATRALINDLSLHISHDKRLRTLPLI